MNKLSDARRLLLSSRSQREDGGVLPLTGVLASDRKRIDKSIAGLLTRGLIEKRATSDFDAAHRTDGDIAYLRTFAAEIVQHSSATVAESTLFPISFKL